MAAGPYDLYRVDPFVPEVEWLSNVQNANLSGGMLDIDTDTEGQLVIVKKDGLYALNSSGDLVATEGFENIDGQTVELSPYTNGMAINSAGTLFLTNSEEDRSTTLMRVPLQLTRCKTIRASFRSWAVWHPT